MLQKGSASSLLACFDKEGKVEPSIRGKNGQSGGVTEARVLDSYASDRAVHAVQCSISGASR